jgi:hypothetical protein
MNFTEFISKSILQKWKETLIQNLTPGFQQKICLKVLITNHSTIMPKFIKKIKIKSWQKKSAKI